jgi:hypothetical protein
MCIKTHGICAFMQLLKEAKKGIITFVGYMCMPRSEVYIAEGIRKQRKRLNKLLSLFSMYSIIGKCEFICFY